MKLRGEETLGRILHRLGLPDTLVSLLAAHASAVVRENDKLGLVADDDLAVILPRHTADSLLFALVREPQPGERWVDVGSGAGFPGLVLACCYPATELTLVEPARRRAAFLELTAGGLGLGNVEVVVDRAERVPGRFDVAVARALAAPDRALADLAALLEAGGEAVLAVSHGPAVPEGAREHLVDAHGADSPGRFFVLPKPGGGR